MSNRFHNKWHRASHHTYKDSSIIDAGWDPIASHESPFRGDFVIDGSAQPYHGSLYSKDIYTVNLWPGDNTVSWKTTTITAHSNFYVSGNETVKGNVNVSGNENVNGNISGHGYIKTDSYLYAVGDITGDSNLYITGDAFIQGNTSGRGYIKTDSYLYAKGNISGEGGLFVTGQVSAQGSITTAKNLYVTGNAKVKEFGDFGSYVATHGSNNDGYGLIIDKKAYVNGETVLNDKTYVNKNGLFVTGDSIFNDDLTIKEQIYVNGTNNNNISGNIRLKGNLSADDYIKTTKDVSAANIYVTDDLRVTGDVYVGDTITTKDLVVTHHLSAVSATFINMDISATEGRGFVVTGYRPTEPVPADYFVVPTEAFIHGDKNVYLDKVGLFVDGWTVLNGNVLLNRTLNVSGDSTLSTLNVTGDSDLDGNLDVGGTLTVTGATTLSTLNAAGAVDFDSTLNVDGATTLNGGATVKTSLIVEKGDKSITFDGEKIYRKNGKQSAVTFLFPSSGGTLVTRPNSPLPPSGNIPVFNEYGNIVDSGNDVTDFYPMVEKTWAQLKDMRDGGTLVPGRWYRITDYVATTSQTDTMSAGNHFDIIVRADTKDKLNEQARAVRHEGDAYFPNTTKFEAWKVWYCLDNDVYRFGWASPNGKGVIYRLIDEFNNDVPYDFKGITMIAYGDTDYVYRYTFDSGAASNNLDLSLYGGTTEDHESTGIYNNIIRPWYDNIYEYNAFRINMIVFKGVNCYSNTFCNDCFNNVFGGRCSYNSFGVVCNGNVFGEGCNDNVFGVGCNDNVFVLGCSSNVFGNYCSDNRFGAACNYNKFGNSCVSNTFENGCFYNAFENDCSYNEFGGFCFYNQFGNNCNHIRFINGSVLKNYVNNITAESGVQYIILNMTGSSTLSAPYRNATLAAGLNHTANYKTITDSTNGGQTFKTVYQPADSRVISV